MVLKAIELPLWGALWDRQLGSECWHIAEHFLMVLLAVQFVAASLLQHLFQKFLLTTYIAVG